MKIFRSPVTATASQQIRITADKGAVTWRAEAQGPQDKLDSEPSLFLLLSSVLRCLPHSQPSSPGVQGVSVE